MMRATSQSACTHRRGGFLAPAVMVALLVVMIAVALVLDRLWLDNAAVEMNAAVEASALSAARQLVTDDLLRDAPETERRLIRAREAAAQIARENTVAGQPLELGDNVRFGRRIVDPESGSTRFLQTETNPNAVVVTGRRTRSNGNPVATLFRHLTGHPVADVTRLVEASFDNHIVGFRPFQGVPVPALPLAILADDPQRRRTDTWSVQIEQRAGSDNFKYDPVSGRVSRGTDGIPEIILKSLPAGGDPADTNVQLVDLNSDFQPDALTRQIERGWNADDLAQWNGGLRIPDSIQPYVTITSSGRITDNIPDELAKLIGQCRICFLYRDHSLAGSEGFGAVDCYGFVAGRVMSVNVSPDDGCEIVFQPGVMTTRTALPAPSSAPTEQRAKWANRYIYKLQITR